MMRYRLLLCCFTVLLSACASTAHFNDVSENEPHATVTFELGQRVGMLLDIRLPSIVPISINDMPINEMEERWKMHPFSEFRIPVGPTTIALSRANESGYPVKGEYGYLKFVALTNEKYHISYVGEDDVTFNVVDTSGLLVASAHVKAEKFVFDSDVVALSSALYDASAKGDVNKVRRLISEGAEVDWSGPSGFTPLGIAASRGQEEVVALLIEAGANVDAHPSWTALHFAADRGYLAIVKRLVEARASVDLRQPGGYSALMLAAEKNYPQIVSVLLAAGADASVRHANGKTALDLAQSEGHYSVEKIISMPR